MDTGIFASQEWADYQAALQEFVDVFNRVVEHQVETNQVIVETVKLQQEVLLNADPAN